MTKKCLVKPNKNLTHTNSWSGLSFNKEVMLHLPPWILMGSDRNSNSFTCRKAFFSNLQAQPCCTNAHFYCYRVKYTSHMAAPAVSALIFLYIVLLNNDFEIHLWIDFVSISLRLPLLENGVGSLQLIFQTTHAPTCMHACLHDPD